MILNFLKNQKLKTKINNKFLFSVIIKIKIQKKHMTIPKNQI